MIFNIPGDAGTVKIGKDTNVGDRCVIHVPTGTTDTRHTVVGSDVYLGSGCVVNGCTIADKAFIGAGVVIGEGALVGASKVEAGSVVAPGTKIPAGQVRSYE